MKAPRGAGGHSEVMDVLFKGQVLAEFIEPDYQGKLGYVYLVYDFQNFAKIVIVSDYFGSCSGCDAWDTSTDEDVKAMCVQLANNAHTFDSVNAAIEFLTMVAASKDAAYYDLTSLAPKLLEKLSTVKL